MKTEYPWIIIATILIFTQEPQGTLGVIAKLLTGIAILVYGIKTLISALRDRRETK